ncbi:TonB-dependent receptor [Chitinophaga horti]|uniref:TonB-dependent receptor n=1 Tax=Chitinophaga horti TaxID=2920382 RepID=A0ABY6J9B7_9BACT|nr:outer membrane beta-barrel family protein [Chitinophaga horti]UYQ94922.1 TonB-dependent receptor [Chitinophaga horti]
MKRLSLIIAAISFTLPLFAQQDTAKQLKTVNVSARKPFVTRKSDRTILDIENSELANGYNGLEVLQKSPGLWVGANGQISINGARGVMVMINDVVQRMSAGELADLLRSFRSEDISKIEVIPNPPSEYEASATGGIVHIVLKRGRQQGVSGLLNAQYRQQDERPFFAGGASLDYKAGRWYAFGGYNAARDKSNYHGYVNTDYADGSKFRSRSGRDNNNTRQQYRAGFVLDISPMHSLTVQHNASANHFRQGFDADVTYDAVTGYSRSFWEREPRVSSTTASYVWKTDSLGSSLKVIADYARQRKDETNTLSSAYSDASRDRGFRTTTPGQTDLYSSQADYTKAFNSKSQFKTGVKYVRTDRENSIYAEDAAGSGWVKNEGASNEFVYNEDLLMAYASFETVIHKTSVKGGLRGEQTWSRGHSVTNGQTIRRDYFGLFPSLFISHQLNETKGNSVQLSYARRVGRPAFNDLNPYRLQVTDFEILTGNPDLQPQYTHSLQAGYTWKHAFNVGLYYRYTRDYISQSASTLDNNIVEYKSQNFPYATELGVSLDLPITINPNWRMNYGLQAYQSSADFVERTIRRASVALKMTQIYKWPKVADFDLYSEYTSPYRSENALQYSVFYTDIGATRSFFKNKLRVRVGVTDIFNTSREKTLTKYEGTSILFYQKRPTRTGMISLTWNFSAGKVFDKKKVEVNNSEEKGRM